MSTDLHLAVISDSCYNNSFQHTSVELTKFNLASISTEHTGASTVSLDLDKKWLDRIRPQMEANGITEWDGKHDCIYGDVSGQVSCG